MKKIFGICIGILLIISSIPLWCYIHYIVSSISPFNLDLYHDLIITSCFICGFCEILGGTTIIAINLKEYAKKR